MGMKRTAAAAVMGTVLALSIFSGGSAAAASSPALKQGDDLAALVRSFNSTVNLGEIYDIHIAYDKLSNQINAAEKAISKVSGKSRRASLSAKYIKPAKIAKERVIYEVSEYRLMKSAGRMVLEDKGAAASSSMKKLDRLKVRAAAIKKAGNYAALPKSVNETLSGIETLLKTNKFAVPDAKLKYKVSDTALDVFLLVNRDRQKADLPMVTLNERLSYAAEMKARDMYANKYFGLNSKKYGPINQMLPKLGITSFSAAGVNIFKNYPTPKSMRDVWRKTSSQKEIVLNAKIIYAGIGTDHEYAAHFFLIP
ncbi:hypothetical protein LRR81_12570 [Metabacillus sp. GX 13764]|uniref:CAP domain-containing protein n=1 Tax=Metabacillus kandeliae TaxID=2900151 RepID=UPI001E639E5B|nr:CAP domain-containing protein [Metabacillus kandeliae]MCD7035083.1 hypothetical protein [Metabacillus kandeliae]